ncbi:hypothetical protein OEA41_010354 [Lepraria neglecta]|uniref:N-acetyltransferase domain-containing protein n=1 Tax=Lepraria neglecta TaxID=209136 RepID=A0AAD9Z0M4_9LECA|nr:hypothetical protein OEA41_010354 [Lepraria neglecta]
MLLNIMFVHPNHRRRGAGALMMEWGMDKAKEKKMETFVEATDMGKSLYERFGLREMYVAHLDGSYPDPSEEWTKMQGELLPMH